MARARASGYDPRKDLRHQGSRARAEAKATVLATSAVTGETIELNARAPRAMSAEDWGRVLDLMRPLISQAGLSPAAARNVLRLVGYTAVGPLRVGIALTPALLLDIETVDRFLTTDGMRYSVAMRSRIQAAARQLGRALGLPGYPPLVTRYPRTGRAAPYTPKDEKRMYSLVRALPEGLRADAATLLDLAFGLGMNGVQARDARTEHMRVRHGEVRLLVRTTRGWKERVAAPEVAERLLARARSVGEDAYLLRPGKSRKRCVEAIVVLMAEKEPGLAGFRVQRAADAWTVRLMTSAGLPALLEILGSSPTSHTLLDLLHYAPQADRGDCETVFRRMHAGSRS